MPGSQRQSSLGGRAAASGQPASEKEAPERISLEALYEFLKDAADLSRVSLAMVVLPPIVAAVSLH